MRAIIAAALLVTAASLLTVSVIGAQPSEPDGAAVSAGPSVSVDTDVSGNSATIPGSADSCISVGAGTSFDTDIYVRTPLLTRSVEDLLAWEIYLSYDREILEIVERDTLQLLSANAGSDVVDVSEGLPDNDGLYRIAAADIGGETAEPANGVLVRLTLQAKANGFSELQLAQLDYSGDGVYDLGPFLTNSAGKKISDSQGDGYFDGPISNARVAVGRSCESLPPIPGTTPDESSDGSPPSETGDDPSSTGDEPANDDAPTDVSSGGVSPDDGDGSQPSNSSGDGGTGDEDTDQPTTPEIESGDGGGSSVVWIVGGAAGTLAFLGGGLLLFAARRRTI